MVDLATAENGCADWVGQRLQKISYVAIAS